jgi:adhesin transport system membrane fusion protein
MSLDITRLLAPTRPITTRYRDGILIAAIVFLTALGVWSAIATVEEQVRAPGTVIVSSRSQVVQSVDGGILKLLHVREGQAVRAGDLIAELDPVRFQASTDEVEAKMVALHATIERLTAELSGLPLRFPPSVHGHRDIMESQRALYEKRQQAQREELSALEQSIALAQQGLDLLLKLEASGDAAQSEILKARQQVGDLRAQLTNKRNAFRQDAQKELANAQADLAQSEQVYAQRNQALQSTYLRAPMSGIVKNVRFTTIGAVLKAGEELLEIVPSDDVLIVEARVRPADVAFLHNGLRANIKLDAYDYTLYGSLKGHVTYISPDTLEDDTRRDDKPYYRVHVETDGLVPKGRKMLDIRPGMTASVEIITGSRTVANFVLKPLRRSADEAMHER